MSKSDIKSKKRTYKKPTNSPTKPEVVEILATEPSELKKKAEEETILLSEDEIEKETTKVFVEGMQSDNIGELMAIQIKMQLGQMMMQMKHERRKEKRDDARLEIFKAKVNNGDELTYENTNYIDEQIMKEIGVSENENETNDKLETIK